MMIRDSKKANSEFPADVLRAIASLMFAQLVYARFKEATLVLRDKEGELTFSTSLEWITENSISKFETAPRVLSQWAKYSEQCKWMDVIWPFYKVQKLPGAEKFSQTSSRFSRTSGKRIIIERAVIGRRAFEHWKTLMELFVIKPKIPKRIRRGVSRRR